MEFRFQTATSKFVPLTTTYLMGVTFGLDTIRVNDCLPRDQGLKVLKQKKKNRCFKSRFFFDFFSVVCSPPKKNNFF